MPWAPGRAVVSDHHGSLLASISPRLHNICWKAFVRILEVVGIDHKLWRLHSCKTQAGRVQLAGHEA